MATTVPARALRHRAPLLWLLLPMIGGLVTGNQLHGKFAIAPVWWVAGGTGALLVAWRFLLRPLIWSAGFLIAIFLLSLAFFELRAHGPNAPDESPPHEATVRIEIDRIYLGASADPIQSDRISGIGRVIVLRVKSIELPGSAKPRLPAGLSGVNRPPLHNDEWLIGQAIYFSLRKNRGTPTLRTATIQSHGVIEQMPRDPPPHSFEEYLAAAGVVAKLSQGRVLYIDEQPSRYARFCEDLRHRLDQTLAMGLEKNPGLSAENRALFLGEVASLRPEKKQLFVETGTLHFFAIDGLHIAAVAVAIHLLFGMVRCPKLLAFAATALALWLYADATGRSPSAVRAVITVLFFEGAYLIRRPINPLAGLTASALIALIISPRELFGAGFVMSYGIVAGLLLLGLPLAESWQNGWRLFRHLPRVSWGPLRRATASLHRHLLGSLAVSLATSLVADLCGVLFFQVYAPSSLLANVVLIPAASAALWACFCSAICGLAHLLWLANVFNHASAFLLVGMDACIRFLVTLPAAVVPRQFITAQLGFLAIAVLLAAMFIGYGTGWTWRLGSWLMPTALCVLALVFLCR